jgi:16S rRNA (cytidine1402-2'-O)-methyltransferase
VAAALAAGQAVEVVPGPSAAISALVISGLPAGRFAFEGFLPRKGSGRAERLAEVAGDRRTVVLYEAPHRLRRTLADLAATCGAERGVAIGRELTKLHEEMWRGTLGDAITWAAEREPRGELVLVLEGAPPPPAASSSAVESAVQARLDAGDTPRDAAATVATQLGVPKREAYEVAVRLRPR